MLPVRSSRNHCTPLVSRANESGRFDAAAVSRDRSPRPWRRRERLAGMSYDAAPDRYDEKMPYRRSGRSGLKLPAVSLGLWQNFGDESPIEVQRAILRRAFDLGVTHFDLAN